MPECYGNYKWSNLVDSSCAGCVCELFCQDTTADIEAEMEEVYGSTMWYPTPEEDQRMWEDHIVALIGG